MILSVSRRTDIPAYYSDWFMNRLKEGFAIYRNPMNHAQLCRVELKPELVDCIVFWTKDPLPMLERIEQVDAMGFHSYFQFTITPYGLPWSTSPAFSDRMVVPQPSYGAFLEPGLRSKEAILHTFRQLSEKLGQQRVLWRYDPIILNNELTLEYHTEMFGRLCSELSGYTKRCIISFVDRYTKLQNRWKEHVITEISPEQMHRTAAAFAKLAEPYGIELQACCEAVDLSADGIRSGACIDLDVIQQVCGHSMKGKKDKSQRVNCGCIQSVDIGAYNTCRNGCIYCYANHSEASILRNCEKHDPNSPILIGTI